MSNIVGKITGQMLESNLLRREMLTGDENLSFESDLLYLDVFNNRIGINSDTPFRTLLVDTDIKSTNLLVDNLFSVPNFQISNNVITNETSNIIVQATSPISLGGLATEGILIDAGFIRSQRSNESIDIITAGSGSIQFYSNVEVNGNLHATGDVTFDGNLVIGDNNTDSVSFAADISGDIIPDVNFLYNIGSPSKKFESLSTVLINGVDYNAGTTIVAGIDLSLRPGNIYFVAENGDNNFTGDHENGPFKTIEYALSQAVSGDTIFIYPGTYMEYWPLIVPEGVTIKGSGLRATKIIPQAATNDSDAFLLNGQTTISDLTIANFFYNSVANTGYAFRFANNFNVTSRSPYIQNISVITENESSLASAGRGAYIDGSVANAASKDASMLFHSATFITPGAECIIMKNGVRVEWLNSFIYYADKGLYAENGSLGFASLGLTYGAEVRSIGSANVYGTYGAWADGDQVLMYLINHNFGYIGSGFDNNNDPTDTNQANEVVELNNGKIYYQSVDHKGDFRVGNELLIEQDTGAITFSTVNITATNLTVTDGSNTTYIDQLETTTGNLSITNNTIQSNSGPINLNPFNTTLSITSNFNGTSFNVTGDLSVPNDTIVGSSSSSTAGVLAQVNSSIIPNTNLYDLGINNKRWNKLYGSSLLFEDIVIDTNVIRTTLSNSNLDLRANGTGTVLVRDSLLIDNNLTVNQNSNLNNTAVSGNLQSSSSNFTNTISAFNFNNGSILFEDNFITTLLSNSNLELRADGTGVVRITDSLLIDQNLIVSSNSFLRNTTSTLINLNGILNVSNNLQSGGLQTDDIYIDDNFITTTLSNSDLEFRANASGGIIVDETLRFTDGTISNILLSGTESSRSITFTPITNRVLVVNTNKALKLPVGNNTNRVLSTVGQVRFNNNLNNFEGRISGSNRNFYGLFDSDANTGITAELTPGANDNTIRMLINGSTQATITNQQLTIFNRLSVDEVRIDSNIISTFNSNADLVLNPSGTGLVKIKDDFSLSNNILTNLNSGAITSIISTGTGYVKFEGNKGLRIPSGDNTERPAGVPLGATRFNTDLSYVEVFDGSSWIISGGGGATISAAEMDDLSNVYALIFG